jgi:hypothetical protein
LNRVAINKPRWILELAEKQDGWVHLSLVEVNGPRVVANLDDADLAALKLFIDGRLAALTPGGDELDVDGDEWKGGV